MKELCGNVWKNKKERCVLENTINYREGVNSLAFIST